MSKRQFFGLLLALAPLAAPCTANAADGLSSEGAEQALRRAVAFYRTEVGYKGAYLYRYSSDLAKQEGEGRAYKTSGWTQPPGTPSVGQAYLDAWKRTGLPLCLDAAREAADALVDTQLKSGGWDSRIEMAPKHRSRYAYRVLGDRAGSFNTTTLDDNKSQSALMFLMRMDEALRFENKRIHEAVEYAWARFLKAQYPNGAWPQRFRQPPDPARFRVQKASYPEIWPSTWPSKDYSGYYTFNDNTIADMISLLFEAHRIYDQQRYWDAAVRTSDFILLAQMPLPQPGWAQQYNKEMHPAWARKFEPPAISGSESQQIMRTLMDVHRCTGEAKYLEAIGPALEYYKQSRLPDGRLARFYELKSNRPLYFTSDYELVYTPHDLPTHYAFIVESHLESIEKEFHTLRSHPVQRPSPKSNEPVVPPMSATLANRAQSVVTRLDDHGAWVEPGRLRYHGSEDKTHEVIESRTFIRNVEILSQYIAAMND